MGRTLLFSMEVCGFETHCWHGCSQPFENSYIGGKEEIFTACYLIVALCVESDMLHNRNPDEWEVFNNPPRHPVKYYSILKKKREFSQLIKQYDAQVLKHGYFHYCSIVPKNISSPLNNKYELFIIFLGKVPNTSFIGFRIKVSKETFIDESNSLLLFLKRLKKPVFYLVNNNCIHVQCGENAWELFYLLYDAYLRQFVLTVIGTQFFYHFVYSFCIQREIQLLELLFKGSKIIRISKKSIYYTINRKRKISISDLIHMTLNMPQNKRCIISFNSKVSLLHSNTENENLYSCSGSKIHVSKLVLKKIKKQILNPLRDNAVKNPVASRNDSASLYPLEMLDSKCNENTLHAKDNQVLYSSSNMKRKLEEIESDKSPTTSKFLKIESVCHTGVKDQWEQYASIKPYSLKSYSGIPCLKHLVPNILSNGKSSHTKNSDSNESKSHSHSSVQSNMVPLILPEKETNLNKDYLSVEETCEIADQINFFGTTKRNYNFESTFSFKENSSDKLNDDHVNTDCNMPNSISSNLKIPVYQKHDSHPQNIKYSSSDTNIPNSLSSPINYYQCKSITSEDQDFITAAGKTVNFSYIALQTAHRLLEDVCNDENQEILRSKSNFDSNKKRFKKFPSIDNSKKLYEKSGTENMSLGKVCVIPSCSIKGLKTNELASKNLEADLPENICENFKPDPVGCLDADIFSTAAGKTLRVSNTAMQTAQKLMQDALQEESVTPTTSNYSRHNKIRTSSSAFRDFGLPLKKSGAEEIDVDMDKTLVEKLFEDTIFDEKELETVSESKNDNTDVEPKSKKNLPIHKPRKSLGGRRNMRFSSNAL